MDKNTSKLKNFGKTEFVGYDDNNLTTECTVQTLQDEHEGFFLHVVLQWATTSAWNSL